VTGHTQAVAGQKTAVCRARDPGRGLQHGLRAGDSAWPWHRICLKDLACCCATLANCSTAIADRGIDEGFMVS